MLDGSKRFFRLLLRPLSVVVCFVFVVFSCLFEPKTIYSLTYLSSIMFEDEIESRGPR